MNKYKTKLTMLVTTLFVIVILIVISIGKKDSKISNEEPLVIGGALGLTGDAAEWGEVTKNAAQIAVDEINEKGGINGRPLRLVVEDSRSTAKDTISAVQKLQTIDGARGILVSWYDAYQGAGSVLDNGSFIISPEAGIEAVNGETVTPNVFSTWYRTYPKSELIVQEMAKNGVKRLYLITENDPYYHTVIEFMTEIGKKYGIEIVGFDKITSADTIKSVLVKVKQEDPDALFFAFYDESKVSEFMHNYKGYTKESLQLYGDELIAQYFESENFTPDMFNGVRFYTAKNPRTDFLNKYKERYNTLPQYSASNSYDAVYMIAKVYEENPGDIGHFLRNTWFETASFGKATFDEIGGIKTNEMYFEVKQVVNGIIKQK